MERERPVEVRFKLMPTSFKFLKGQVSVVPATYRRAGHGTDRVRSLGLGLGG